MLKKYISLFLLVGFFNFFFFHKSGPVSFVLASTAFFIFCAVIFITKKNFNLLSRIIFGSGALLVLLNSLLVSRAQGFVQLALSVSIFGCLAIALYLLSSQINFVRSLAELVFVPFFLVLNYIKAIFNNLNNLISGKINFPRFKKGGLGKLAPIVTGLIVGIPAALVLIHLFSLADPIFAAYASIFFKLLNIRIPEQLVARIFVSVILLLVFAPFLYFPGGKKFRSPISLFYKYSFHRQMTVVMLLVFLTVGAFLIVQAPYVFVNVPAETSLSKFGIATYSEYVKRGFTELIFIALIIYFLVWMGLAALRNRTKEKSKILLFYVQLFVLMEFFVFLFSIFRRVYLYQLYHGLSLVRIYGAIFLVWIFLIGLTLVLRHFRQKTYVYAEVIFSGILIIIFGLFNAENYIALVNPPHVNRRIDYTYLARMSADGLTGWKKAYLYAQEILSNKNLINREVINREERREVAYAGMIINNLLNHYHQLNFKYGAVSVKKKDYLDEIFTFNFSEKRAYKLIMNEIPFSELLVLEQNYIDLNNKINGQSEGEREFDIDVSFNTPFL